MLYRVIGIAIAIYLAGCAASLPPLPPPTAASLPPMVSGQQQMRQEPTYIINPEDILRITVYEHPDLSLEVTVLPDGSFAYPLLGNVQAAGLSVPQLERQMTQRLGESYLVSPQVTVILTQSRSRQVYVLGEVKAPGIYIPKHNATLLEVISQAGGMTAEAGWSVTVVHASGHANGKVAEPRQQRGEIETVTVSLSKLLAGETLPIGIRAGDTVYVHKQAYFFVSGEIRNPGRYPLEEGTTVFRAITIAGGFGEFAAKKRVKVQRVVDGDNREFAASLVDAIQPGDVIIVPESIF